MHYRFTDYDRRDYERDTIGSVTIESKMGNDGRIEVSCADSKGAFIIMKLNDLEAAAICSAVSAARAKCESRVLIGE
jgi:hypothetical protein